MDEPMRGFPQLNCDPKGHTSYCTEKQPQVFSVFISHVIKTKNRNRSINKFKDLGYDR